MTNITACELSESACQQNDLQLAAEIQLGAEKKWFMGCKKQLVVTSVGVKAMIIGLHLTLGEISKDLFLI